MIGIQPSWHLETVCKLSLLLLSGFLSLLANKIGKFVCQWNTMS